MRRRIGLAMILLLALSMVFVSAASAAHKPKLEKWRVYSAALDSLNNSGVDGQATVYWRQGTTTVHIYAEGLEPGQSHLQHIHGFEGVTTDAVCPPPTAAGDDGILSLADGLPYYGPIMLPLDLSDGSFPMPNACNEEHYMRTFSGQEALLPLRLRTVVLHGMTIGGTYDATLPVACGEFEYVGTVKVRSGEIVKWARNH